MACLNFIRGRRRHANPPQGGPQSSNGSQVPAAAPARGPPVAQPNSEILVSSDDLINISEDEVDNSHRFRVPVVPQPMGAAASCSGGQGAQTAAPAAAEGGATPPAPQETATAASRNKEKASPSQVIFYFDCSLIFCFSRFLLLQILVNVSVNVCFSIGVNGLLNVLQCWYYWYLLKQYVMSYFVVVAAAAKVSLCRLSYVLLLGCYIKTALRLYF